MAMILQTMHIFTALIAVLFCFTCEGGGEYNLGNQILYFYI
jgi:hypothetical protein